MKKIVPLLIVIGLLALAIVVWFALVNKKSSGSPTSPKTEISSFEECVKAGNPVQESYPARCSADGKTFTEDIGNALEKQNLIRLEVPTPNQVVKSPLEIKGEAVGNWFFEASFPVKIVDGNGKVLGQVPATTVEDWMTNKFISFSATLTFENSATVTGKLVLEKDNPSGLAENADSLEVPVKFR